jgi:hypothetical protein
MVAKLRDYHGMQLVEVFEDGLLTVKKYCLLQDETPRQGRLIVYGQYQPMAAQQS